MGGKFNSEKSLFAKIASKDLMNRNRINSTNMLPSFVNFNQNQRAALIGEGTLESKKTRRGTLELI